MHRQSVEEKTIKTGAVFAVANMFVGLISCADSTLGLVSLLAVNGALLYQLHQLGKRRRPGSNALNTAHSFFSSQVNAPSHDVENVCRNIVNGGAAVFDEVDKALSGRSP